MAKCQAAIDVSIKLAVIEAIEARDRRKSDVAKSYNMPKSTVSTILKNKVKLCELLSTSKIVAGSKRTCEAAHGGWEEALFIWWFRRARSMMCQFLALFKKSKLRNCH